MRLEEISPAPHSCSHTNFTNSRSEAIAVVLIEISLLVGRLESGSWAGKCANSQLAINYITLPHLTCRQLRVRGGNAVPSCIAYAATFTASPGSRCLLPE